VPPPIELSTRFQRYNVVTRHASTIVPLTAAVSFTAWQTIIPDASAPAFGAVVLLVLVASWALFQAPRRPRPVKVDEEGITLDGARIEREAIRFGYFTLADEIHQNRMELHDAQGAPLATICVDADTGGRILSQLRIGAATFTGKSPLGSIRGLLNVITYGIGFVLVLSSYSSAQSGILPRSWGSLLLGLTAIAVSEILLGPKRIVVARDDLFVALRLGLRQRFIPWSDVASVRSTRGGVRVELSRSALTIPVEEEMKSALLPRIEEGLSAFRATEATALAARLARGGRGREAWLRSLSDREGDFRSAPVSDEQLWHLVESAGTPATARAAAALILSRDAGDEERRRLRIAAEACALPRLRVLLDEAGKGTDEEALGEALDALEDEGDAGRVKAARVGG
jgi:hypothetical protein